MKMPRLIFSQADLSYLLHAQAPAAPAQSRLLCMFFDLNTMDAAAQTTALQNAMQFVEQQAQAGDLIAVMTYTSQLNVLQDFTMDHNLTVAGLRMIMPSSPGKMPDTAAQLQAIRSAISALSALPGKKAVIYFSSAIQRAGVDNQEDLEALIQDAVRANIVIYPDARGLTPSSPVTK
jgi:VWFA-related protein